MTGRAQLLRRLAGKAFLYLVLLLGALVLVLPFLWMVSTSLKSANDVFKIPPQWIPAPAQWRNYPDALQKGNMPLYFLNSILVSGVTVLIRLFICAMAGYGLAKFEFQGRSVIFGFILSTLMIPFEIIIVPLYLTAKALGWLNTYQGLIIPLSVSAFGVFIMRQHLLSIPDDLMNSARIDGASEFRIFIELVMPLSSAALIALGIFTFIESWDNLLWPLVVVSKDSMRTIALGLASFENAYMTNYGHLMAVAFIATAPIIIAYAIFQRFFIEGIAMTGFK
jgi:multiple sugar transport system permease protein